MPRARIPTAHCLDFHLDHEVGQDPKLIFASAGVITVTTDLGTWVLPSQRALWVPAAVSHAIRATGTVLLRTIYLDGPLAEGMPRACRVVAVSGLLREAILRAVELGPTLLPRTSASRYSLVHIILSELHRAHWSPVTALHLPAPRDKRLLRLTESLLETPWDQATLKEWGRRVGASERTLGRLFAAETSMSFTQWRRLLRLRVSLEMLSVGMPVGVVGGQMTGETPTAYQRRANQNPKPSPA